MKKTLNILLIFLISYVVSNCGGGGSSPDFLKTFKPGLNNAIVNSNSRGKTKLEVYLPPKWSKDVQKTYPVIFFLHGQGGKQTDFFKTLDSTDLDRWINQGELPAFVFISIQSLDINGVEQQWSSSENETFLTSDEKSELRSYALKHFKAGDSLGSEKILKTSIHGFSRGARGAVHYAVKFPKRFTSAVSDAFVSDYALDEEENYALKNKSQFLSSGIKLRMSVGDRDSFEERRHVTIQMHNYLNSLGLPHEYEVLTNASHNLYTIFNSVTESTLINGLYELKYHANTWK